MGQHASNCVSSILPTSHLLECCDAEPTRCLLLGAALASFRSISVFLSLSLSLSLSLVLSLSISLSLSLSVSLARALSLPLSL
jgi:hypothetical protein